MAISQISICNSAIIKVGGDIITSITEDKKSAKILNAVYAQIRDEVLRSRNWNFAMKRATMTPTANTPPYEYDYEFSLPMDCLRVVDIENEYFDENFDFTIEGETLLCNEASINFRYIFRNEDESSYDPMFAECLAWRLAQEIAYAITQSAQMEDQMKKRYSEALAYASSTDSIEGTMKPFVADIWTNARRR